MTRSLDSAPQESIGSWYALSKPLLQNCMDASLSAWMADINLPIIEFQESKQFFCESMRDTDKITFRLFPKINIWGLSWTLNLLEEDNKLEEFLAGISSFLGLCKVMDPRNSLLEEIINCVPAMMYTLFLFIKCTFSFELVSEAIQEQQRNVYMMAASTTILWLVSLSNGLTGCRVQHCHDSKTIHRSNWVCMHWANSTLWQSPIPGQPTLGYKTVHVMLNAGWCVLFASLSFLLTTDFSLHLWCVLGTSQMLACTAGCLTWHCPPTWCVSRLHSHHILLCSMNHNTLCLHCAPLSHLRDSKGSKEWQWMHGNRNENGNGNGDGDKRVGIGIMEARKHDESSIKLL